LELDAAKAALRADADILAHTVRDRQLDEEFLALAKASNVINTTTAGAFWGHFRGLYEPATLSEADRSCGDPEVIESWNRWGSVLPAARPPIPGWIRQWTESQRQILANIRALHQAGVRIAVGSDGGNIGSMHGASFHKELHLLAEAGLPPMAIIVAATRHGAEALGLEQQLGTLEVGKLADLVVLEANPLADIENINRIAYVMLRVSCFRDKRSLRSPEGDA
jgi:imidazolonepropionase-like amidohydrolase